MDVKRNMNPDGNKEQPLADPRTHPDWLAPHSFAWYARLGQAVGNYAYPWKSAVFGPDAEKLFETEVSGMVAGREVLDVGCGHGEFTVRWSPDVKRIVGLDVTEAFLESGRRCSKANVTFIAASTKETLPFGPGEFDCAYIRKGPTSAYPDLGRVIRKGGRILGLHPGDRMSEELPELFPGLFQPRSGGTVILDMIKSRLAAAGLSDAVVETVKGVQILNGPMDVVHMCCFGQTAAVQEMVVRTSLPAIERIFARHASGGGLPVTVEHYVVRAVV